MHISEYSGSANPEAEFIKRINQELLKYDFSIGWYSTGIARYHEDTQEYLDGVNTDLAVLHNRCVENDVDSIVEFNSAGVPYIRSNQGNFLDCQEVRPASLELSLLIVSTSTCVELTI